ncbi:MAG: hypothetical protein MJ179_02550 [Treponema sp.]|nr:hypothetical protein [Treponema sp.]
MIRIIGGVVFGLLGLFILVLVDGEEKMRNKKELFKANLLMKAIKFLFCIDFVILLLVLFL